jgi:SOS-response transcriptional repressor LexA
MASKNLLTEQDKIAYSVISKFIKENGYPPSVRELCKIMGKSSTATIKYRLKSLEQKGFIKTTSGAKRTIRLLNEVEQGRCDWCKTGEQKCGDCIHADLCEHNPNIPLFNRANAAYCKGFKDRASVVEVVRCKDCKNNGQCSIQDAMNWTPKTEIVDYFCSYGERRT